MAKPCSYALQFLQELCPYDESPASEALAYHCGKSYRRPSHYNPYAGGDALRVIILESAFLSILLLIDIGNLIRYNIQRIADPVEREVVKKELMIELRKLRRPFYYKRETERRRALAKARRKIKRRKTYSPMPTPEQVMEAWNKRKESKEAMITLGGMLHDLECYVDNRVQLDDFGDIVSRHGGIRGWLATNLPELLPKYKTLMRYKAMAIKLRQATETKDPRPTKRLLRKPFHSVVEEILSYPQNTFAIITEVLDRHLSPERIFDG